MPQLQPFRALRYDSDVVPDMAAVLCPPYDVIAPDERRRLAARDPHNAVHVELPAPLRDAGASTGEALADPYHTAGQLFATWQADGVLRRDPRPALYVYQQRYRLAAGEVETARGFYCRLQLEEPGAGVRRHEGTLSGPKEDRLRLLRAVRANLSPVLLLYDDGAAGARSASLLDRLAAGEAAMEAHDERGASHRLWPVDGRSSDAAALLELAGGGALTIADGHHRYETALRFRAETGDGGADFAMALLFDAASGGLTILPTHRLLHRLADEDALRRAVDELFETTARAAGTAVADAVTAAGPGTIGLAMRGEGRLLRARAEALAELLPPASTAWRSLDVTAIAALVERLYGVTSDELAGNGRLSYTKDATDALAQVGGGRADACFIVAATPVEAVLAVAAAGELMPPKSTYFVPKAATGLVFNLLDA